jgi:uncharacterized protein (UPF0332 family)
MPNRRRFLYWCSRQNRGVRLVKPSENLVKAYRDKYKNALKSMEVNANAAIIDWAISASYYARYFAVYSLLAKIGVKCEIHDCTIALFEYLFRSDMQPAVLRQLRESKENRIDAQYYPYLPTVDFQVMLKDTRQFVLEIEMILDQLNAARIAQLQGKLKRLKVRPR